MLRIKTKVFYPYPPEQVWLAIADRRGLAAWLMDNDFEPRIGHKFRFQAQPLPGLDKIIHCEVIELEKPRRLSYTWQGENLSKSTIVTWTLEPIDGGTHLQLEHTGFESEVIKLGEPIRCSHTQQSNSLPQLTLSTPIGEPVRLGQQFQLGHKEVQNFDNATLNFYLSHGWHSALNNRLQKVLTDMPEQSCLTSVAFNE